MTKTTLLAASLCLGFAFPVVADPQIGIGFSVSFGAGQPDAGFAIRVFSDDEPDTVAASVGVDLMFETKQVRPTVGAVYLGTSSFVGLDLGYNLGSQGFDYGFSVGGLPETTTPDTDSSTDFDFGSDTDAF